MRTSLLVSALAIFTACAAFDSGQCGPTAGGQNCKDNNCCSKYGWCGTADSYCLPTQGCNPSFGRCKGASSPPIVVKPSSKLPSPVGKSTDKCGSAAKGLICASGYCCSPYGYCGKTSAYCSTGCQPRFGSCSVRSSSSLKSSTKVSTKATTRISTKTPTKASTKSSTKVSTKSSSKVSTKSSTKVSTSSAKVSTKATTTILTKSPTKSSTKSSTKVSTTSAKVSTKISTPSASSAPISKNGRCGTAFGGQTCTGSSWGSCCSVNSWCGSTKDHCMTGCKSAFGKCSGTSSSSSTRRSLSTIRSSSSTSARVSSSKASVLAESSTTKALESSSTSQAPPSTSSSTSVNRVLLPDRDPSVDRASSKNLNPASPLTLFYSESSPGTYTMLIKATLASGKKGILLENIAAIDSISCSPTTLRVSFSNEAAGYIATTWPSGTLLFTLSDGCNPANERGVYTLSTTYFDSRGGASICEFTVSESTLKEVVDELDISYGQTVSGPNGDLMTSYTTTVTSYYTNPSVGTLTSSTFVSTITPSLTTMTYTSASSVTSTETFSLSPSAAAILSEISAGLPPAGEDGTIDIPISKTNDAIIPMQPLTAEYNEDAQHQAALQAEMQADLLDSTETLVTEALNALGEEAESNVSPDSPIQLVVSNYAGTDDAIYDSADPVTIITSSVTKTNTPVRAVSAPAPRSVAVPLSLDKRALEKRDGWSTFFDVMGDDLVGEVCELCGAISAGKDLYDAFKCLFGSCPSPPKVTISTLSGYTKQEYSMSSTMAKNGLIFGDLKATVLCADCYIKVTSLKVEGNVKIIAKQINYPEDFVISASFTATQSSVVSMLFNIRTKGAASGSFDRALSSWKIDSLTVPSVFTVSPRFLYGMGLTYDTAQAVDVQAGAVMTLSNAAADLDVKGKTASNARNWQPSAQVTYPTLVKPGHIALSPYVKTDIQLSLTIFGQYLENAAVLTTQTNMGFDAQVLTAAETVSKRTIATVQKLHPDVGSLEKRWSFGTSLLGMLAAAKAAAALAGKTPVPNCNVGSLKLNAIMHTKNQAVVGGKAIVLFDEDSRFGSQCIPFAASPASSSSTLTSATPSTIASKSSSTLAPVSTPVFSSAFSSSTSATSFTSTPTSATSSPAATPTACTNPPLGFVPPSGSNCFKVVGHGVAAIDGKYLSKQQGWGNPEFQWQGSAPSVFYLDSNGYMYEALQGSILATDRDGGGAWLQFTLPQYAADLPKAVCTKGPSSSLSCFQTTTSVISISTAFGDDDSRQVTPMFGTPDRNFQPITLTYEETACPALCTVTPSSTSTSSSSLVPTIASTSVIPSTTAKCSTSLSTVAPAGSTCFTVTGHGPAHVEGQLLGMQSGYSGSVFGWDKYTPATFYQDTTGFVYIASEIANGWVMSMVADVGASPWMGFYPTSDVARLSYPKATCSLSPQGKTFTCTLAGFSTYIVAPSKSFYSSSDTRSGNPIFGVVSGPWVAMTMTYNEVACPFKCVV